MENEQIEIQESTKETYRRHYRQMERESSRLRWNGLEDHTPDLQEEDILHDLLTNPKKHRLSTLVARRNALIYIYKNMGHIKMLRELYAHDIMDKLRAAAGAGRENSREKGRMIPEKDFWKIHYKLMTMKDWGIRAQHLMLAGLGSGARPIEWVNAKWINEPNGILRLQTAKVKNINAWNNVPPMFFGEEDDENPPEFSRAYINQFRNKIDQLDLLSEQKEELNKNKFLENEVLFRDVYIEEEYRFVITMHMENIRFFFNTHDPNYTIWDMPSEIKAKYYRDVYYNHCRQSVYQACKKLFGTEKRYSPVDTRSTFSANRRAMKGNAAAAIEMGNASGGARIASHYSKKSLAWEKYRNWQQDGAKQDPRPQNEKWGQEQSQSFDPAISHQNY